MTYLFLDVDGVLNSMGDGFSMDLETDRHFEFLKKIVQATGATIILSSSWRRGLMDNSSLISRLAEYGMSIKDITPIRHDGDRGLEIMAWLIENGFDISKDKVIILDDDDFDFKSQFPECFVKTDAKYGLQEKDIQRCLDVVRKQCFGRNSK